MKNEVPKFQQIPSLGKWLYRAENAKAKLVCQLIDPRRTTLNADHLNILHKLGWEVVVIPLTDVNAAV